MIPLCVRISHTDLHVQADCCSSPGSKRDADDVSQSASPETTPTPSPSPTVDTDSPVWTASVMSELAAFGPVPTPSTPADWAEVMDMLETVKSVASAATVSEGASVPMRSLSPEELEAIRNLKPQLGPGLKKAHKGDFSPGSEPALVARGWWQKFKSSLCKGFTHGKGKCD